MKVNIFIMLFYLVLRRTRTLLRIVDVKNSHLFPDYICVVTYQVSNLYRSFAADVKNKKYCGKNTGVLTEFKPNSAAKRMKFFDVISEFNTETRWMLLGSKN